ncbi:cysteine-rich outer membrane protein [Thiomicrorhabdus sp.]|uniref:cysteine-rich outer membrane protein n=1 Tax=Thiomicrorhabdus sp. TaxID=2039724 RepID=UPI0029C74588|nr:cysteine-rich outer membrane protein [Thiomicrorhabdus sp.]
MKNWLRTLFAPLLNPLEHGDDDFIYKPSHRTILVIMGVIFLILASVALFFAFKVDQMAVLIPTLVFASIGCVSLIVATVGNDKAVSKIWRNR